ncbi:MAG: Dna2/Cas4 domain-containing protein [Methanimicrococcus sp.]|nr:Dna2/Cas4 domain-containing protein [Methanimicrococcus sp.]
MDEKSISVYDIKQWAACPRQLYFKKNAEKKGRPIVSIYENPAFFEKALYRELLFAIPELALQSLREPNKGGGIDENKLKSMLKETAGEIMEEMLSLTPGTNMTGTGPDGDGKENRFLLDFPNEKTERLAANVLLTAERHGPDLYKSAACPISEEKMYYSQKLNLYGTPAKVLILKEQMVPYMIRLSKPPQNGVWENDRVTAAAYIMILKNEYGQEKVSESAAADYFGEYRLFQIRAADKRKVFRAIRKIKDIQDGKMPEEKNIRLCKQCLYKEACQPRLKSFFSKIFE